MEKQMAISSSEKENGARLEIGMKLKSGLKVGGETLKNCNPNPTAPMSNDVQYDDQ